MSARHVPHPWTLLTAALAAVLLVVAGVAVLAPEQEPSAPSSSDSPTPTVPPWERTNLPGYDPDPGPLSLPAPDRTSGTPLTASFAAWQRGAQLPPASTQHAIGLSFDATELANDMWADPRSNLSLTLQQLSSPTLRFGGNGVDRRMWWTSSQEPAPDWAEATVTPQDLERVARVAEQADAEVTLVLDLGHDDPERAADMAAHAQQAFGDRLVAVSIGNEPNGFHHPNQMNLAVRGEGWSPAAYQGQLAEYAQAVEAAAPGLPIAGPGAYDAPWWRAFAQAPIADQAALSMHWYPLWQCEGPSSSPANPTIEDLTNPQLRERVRRIVGMGAEVAAENDLPLWMEETGPTSCPGTNDTSRTHAQALWTVDYALTLAELGVERTAFHSTLAACDGGAPMSPLCASGTLHDPGLLIQGRSSYLALMQMSQLPQGRALIPTMSGDGRVMTHAVLGSDGSLGIAIVDLRDPADREGEIPVELRVTRSLGRSSPDRWTLAEGSRLAAQGFASTSSSLGALAPIDGPLADAPLSASSPLTVTSRAGSVTVLTLAPADAAGASDDGGAADAGSDAGRG